MNIKSILMTGIIGLGLGSIASAATVPQVTIHFTGSTAFRTNTQAAMYNCMTGSIVGAKSGDGAGTYTAIRGTMNGKDTFITCYWSGSELGVKALASPGGLTQPFLSYGVTDVATALTKSDWTGAHALTGNADPSVGANTLEVLQYVTDNSVPDVAMADTYQSSSKYKAVAGSYNTLVGPSVDSVDGKVGVISFKWIASHGTPLTGITAKQANQLYTKGYLPLSYFTGNSTDESSWVYATGRDQYSGTRLTAAVEMGLSAVAGLAQWQPQDSSSKEVDGTAAIAKLVSWPATSGYPTGGYLCKALWNSVTGASNAYVIGYAGQPDTDKGGSGNQGVYGTSGAVELTWNGVLLGTDFANTGWHAVAEGKYSFWGYEHMYMTSTFAGTSSDALTAVNTIANEIATGATSGTPAAPHPYLSEMMVSRATDGALLTYKGNQTKGSTGGATRPF